jgi:hypothetical protein
MAVRARQIFSNEEYPEFVIAQLRASMPLSNIDTPNYRKYLKSSLALMESYKKLPRHNPKIIQVFSSLYSREAEMAAQRKKRGLPEPKE